jgi:hypothetical protein
MVGSAAWWRTAVEHVDPAVERVEHMVGREHQRDGGFARRARAARDAR